MKKRPIFKIDNNVLLWDCTLIEFNDTPLLVVCIDGNDYYYLVLRFGLDAKYYVARIDLMCLNNMLTGSITMRDALLSSNMNWLVSEGEDINHDCIIARPDMNKIYEYLPIEGAYFKSFSTELDEYVESIKLKSSMNANWTTTENLSKILSVNGEEFFVDFDLQYYETSNRGNSIPIESFLLVSECKDYIVELDKTLKRVSYYTSEDIYKHAEAKDYKHLGRSYSQAYCLS